MMRTLAIGFVVVLAGCAAGAPSLGSAQTSAASVRGARPERVVIQPERLVFPSPQAPARSVKVHEVGGTFADACTPNGIAVVGVGAGDKGVTPVSVRPEAAGKCLVYFLGPNGAQSGTFYVTVK